MMPALAAAMLAPPLLVPYYYYEEIQWLAKDQLTALNHRSTEIEERIVRQMKTELRTLLALDRPRRERAPTSGSSSKSPATG
jgi:hypothetical protein